MLHLSKASAADQPTVPPSLPSTVCWHAVGMKWQLSFTLNPNSCRLRLDPDYPHLHFTGPAGSEAQCPVLYRRFLLQQAKQLLPPIMHQLSAECELPFASVSFGQQKTLWGSCSSDKTIRLNAKLLYLPPRLMRYVMVHELCHTIHMHHQPEFWNLVGSYLPDYRDLKRQMRQADRYIPGLLNG